ncbi:MAG: GTPase, partial [bacterium]
MIDTAKITISGGNGGDGLITFAKGKFKPKGPPMGGSGGRGGTVYLIADNNTATLKDFTTAKLLKAENGGSGGSNDKTGKCGEDLFIKVPIGTTVIDELNTVLADLDKNGKVFLVAKGGNGGRGNAHMAKDLSPRRKEGIKESVDAITTNLMGYSGKRFSKEKHIYYAEKGSAGEIKQIKLELKLIADVGLIGLPNAGKSSLLNSLTKTTKAPVGSYPFTTLEPNLGVVFDPNSQSGCVIADIPGLIEGAHEGKGLGGKFLKHVE